MRLVSRTSTVMALLHASTEALTFRPTPTVAGPHGGLQITHYTSKPTSLPYDMQNVLRARQAGNTICGWVGGSAWDPVICPTGNYCATLSTYVGCCELVSCIGVFTTCYDILGPICDASCQNNIGNLICQTHSYCAEYLYPGGSVGYGCQTVIGYTTSVLLSTVSNVGPLTTSEMTSQGPTVSTVSSSSSTSTSPTPTSTSVPTSGGNTLNGGSIAGITIGAITVLAIIFTLLWLLARRHTRGAHVHDGSEQLGRSNRTSTVTYQLQDQYGYGGQILSGAFAPFPKNDVRDERYYPTVPESQQAVSPGQEDGMESRQAMYPAGYSGPTMPEMPGLVPRTS